MKSLTRRAFSAAVLLLVPVFFAAADAIAAGPAAATAPAEASAVTRSIDLGEGVSLVMVNVKGGVFKMGSALSGREVSKRYGGPAESYQDQNPQHEVAVKGFWMGRTEVTRRQFAAFVRATRYETEAEKAGFMEGLDWSGDGWAPKEGLDWKKPGFVQSNAHPVVGVSHNDAKAFCAWLSKKSGLSFRLPTEAEWEYAARAGSTAEFPWGDDIAGGKGYGNVCDETAQAAAEKHGTRFTGTFPFSDGYVFTAPAGRFKPNDWGLFDMQGNVEEWCEDWYGDDYYDSAPKDKPQDNPKGPEKGETRIVRGGNWYLAPALDRCAYRSGYEPDKACDQVGFRVVCD